MGYTYACVFRTKFGVHILIFSLNYGVFRRLEYTYFFEND